MKMMLKVRKVLHVILALSLLLAFAAACANDAAPGGSDGQPPAPSGGGSSDTGGGGSDTSPPDLVITESGPFGRYAETVVITIPIAEWGAAFFVDGESHTDNLVTRHYEEVLNVRFEAKWEVDGAQGEERMNTAIAANDLPDMFTVGSALLGRLIQADQIQELGQVFDEYASDRFREIATYQDGRGFLASTNNGKVYGIPESNDFANNVAMTWIRKDWLDALNLELPKTLDELLNIARAFRDQDPGGVGADIIPIASDMNFGQMGMSFNVFANPLMAYRGIWIPDGQGGLTYSSIQPEMRDTLQLMQDMYAEGLFDQEFAVKNEGLVFQDVAAGKVGIFPGVFWSSLWPLFQTLENIDDADWVAVPVGLDKNGQQTTQNTIFSYASVVVRKGFEHPEAAVKCMNLWAEMFHGEYADHFNLLLSTEKYMPIADQWHSYAMPTFFSHPLKNGFLSQNFIEMWEKQDRSLALTGEAANRFDIVTEGGPQGWGHYMFLTSGYPVAMSYNGNFIYNEFVGAPTETLVLRGPTLTQMEYEAFIAIIMGSPISEFDRFVDDWKNQGGDAITDEVNAWYRSVQ